MVLAVLFFPLALAGQDSDATRKPSPFCFRARPRPACSGFAVTTFGAYVVVAGNANHDTPLRAVADWGLMFNVSDRDAIGASLLASLDEAGFAAGPMVRYRRWLPPARSLEVAVGIPVTTGEDVQRGSVLGLVRWSPSHWFAVAARPEILRRLTYVCGPSACVPEHLSRARLSVGAELGEVPGAVMTGASGVVGFIIVLILISADES